MELTTEQALQQGVAAHKTAGIVLIFNWDHSLIRNIIIYKTSTDGTRIAKIIGISKVIDGERIVFFQVGLGYNFLTILGII